MKGRMWYSLKKDLQPFITGTLIYLFQVYTTVNDKIHYMDKFLNQST